MYLHLGADCMIKNTVLIFVISIRKSMIAIFLFIKTDIKLSIYQRMVNVPAVF